MASSKTTHNSTWVSTKTWVTGELVTAANLNTYISSQDDALKTPAYFRCWVDEASNYTTVSTSFTDVDATNLGATITTGGGAVLVGFQAVCLGATSNEHGYFDVDVDGTRIGTNDGLTSAITQSNTHTEAFTVLVTGLSAGSHTFKIQFKSSSGASTFTVYAGAGTAKLDVHPVFWGIELA